MIPLRRTTDRRVHDLRHPLPLEEAPPYTRPPQRSCNAAWRLVREPLVQLHHITNHLNWPTTHGPAPYCNFSWHEF